MKEAIKNALEECVDVAGTKETCSYADSAHALANALGKNTDATGIAICGSGHGIAMALNRHSCIRAARCLTEEDATLARAHNNANVLVLAARQTATDAAEKIVHAFLNEAFEGGRHQARVAAIDIPL